MEDTDTEDLHRREREMEGGAAEPEQQGRQVEEREDWVRKIVVAGKRI